MEYLSEMDITLHVWNVMVGCFQTWERCCRRHFPRAIDVCMNDGDELCNTDRYFADFQSGLCLQDCAGGNLVGCAGVPPPINLFNSIKACCDTQS